MIIFLILRNEFTILDVLRYTKRRAKNLLERTPSKMGAKKKWQP